MTGAQSFSGQVEATNQAATNATSVITRGLYDSRFAIEIMRGMYDFGLSTSAWNIINVSTGSVATYNDTLVASSGATAGGIGFANCNGNGLRSWHKANAGGRRVVNWSYRTVFSTDIMTTALAGSDTVFRFMVGQNYTQTTAADLVNTDKGLGFKIVAGLLSAQVANGTTLTTTSTGRTLSNLTDYNVTLDSDGAGNWVCYLNGVSVASGTGAPTGNASAIKNAVCVSATNGTTASNREIYFGKITALQI